jgi:Ca2+/Na+ antiporter
MENIFLNDIPAYIGTLLGMYAFSGYIPLKVIESLIDLSKSSNVIELEKKMQKSLVLSFISISLFALFISTVRGSVVIIDVVFLFIISYVIFRYRLKVKTKLLIEWMKKKNPQE